MYRATRNSAVTPMTSKITENSDKKWCISQTFVAIDESVLDIISFVLALLGNKVYKAKEQVDTFFLKTASESRMTWMSEETNRGRQ